MPTTGSGQFPYPNSSAVPDVPADVLLLAQRVDKMASGWTVCADATARAALVTNSDAYEGLAVYQIDTKQVYVYQSSAWVLQGSSSAPAFQVGRGSTQAIGANAWTLLSSCYGTPGLNVGFTSFSSGVLTVATSGWYRISLLMKWPTTANPLATQITVNSTSVDTSATVVAEWKATAAAAAMSGLVYLTAADALRVYVFTTAAQNAGTNPRDIGWSVEYVRA